MVFWYRDANPLVRCCITRPKGQTPEKLELNWVQKINWEMQLLLFTLILSLSLSSPSLLPKAPPYHLGSRWGTVHRHKITSDSIIHAIKTENHTTETKYLLSNKTCTWNYTSSGWNMTWFTIYKVHQINISVKGNVIQLNTNLNCDSRKLMKVSDIS